VSTRLCGMRLGAAVAAAALAFARPGVTQAADIELWTARALATVLAEVGPEFERATGHRVVVRIGLPADFDRRAAAGDPFDVVISTSSTVDRWIRAGRLVAESRLDLARSGIGVEVRAGAPKPDIRTVAAFRKALLDARSIAYLKIGSGLHVDGVIERLGIADAVRPKVTRPDTDIVSELVAKGEIELGMVVTTQILTTPGVELVGPLPEELQSHIVFAGAVGRHAKAPEAAKELLKFLRSATVEPVLRAQGMDREF
jgi:molybdate transport system substrate-binding protein